MYQTFLEHGGLTIEQNVGNIFEYRVVETGKVFDITKLKNWCGTPRSPLSLHADVLREAVEHGYFTVNQHMLRQ